MIDSKIENLIYLLNENGMITEASCEGHRNVNMDGYVMFDERVSENDIITLLNNLPKDRINNYHIEKYLRSIDFDDIEIRSNWTIRFPMKTFKDKNISPQDLKDRCIKDLENALQNMLENN